MLVPVVKLLLYVNIVRRCCQEKKPSTTPVSSYDIFHDTPVYSPDPHVISGGKTKRFNRGVLCANRIPDEPNTNIEPFYGKKGHPDNLSKDS